MCAPPVSRPASRLGYLALASLDTWLSGLPRPRGPSGAARHQAAADADPRRLAGHRPASGRSPLRAGTLVAQAGGWGGDVALLGSGTAAFLTGVASFGSGHLAYLGGFWRHRAPGAGRDEAGPRAVAAAWALTAPMMSVYAARQHRELGGPVLGYATLLAAMAAASTRLDPALPATARRLSATGAALFLVSDTVLGLRTFGVVPPRRVSSGP